MKTPTSIVTAFGAAALSVTAVPAIGQNTADPAASTTTYPAPARDDDDSGKWGLVGLLGLAGLLGLKRRDRDHDDRRRTTTGTNTNRP